MNSILFFDLFAATYLLFLGFSGFKNGWILEIGKIIGLIITLWVSIEFYIELAEVIQQEISFDPVATLFISFIIIFTLTFIITRIVIALIDQIIGIRKTRFFNQLLGFFLGMFKGTIMVLVVLWTFELMPYQKWTDTLYTNSTIAHKLRQARDTTIDYMGWENPINEGKAYIRSLIKAESTDPAEEE